MKVVKIKIKKFKKIKDFEKDVKGNSFFVLGPNEAGKSTLLQFIQIALGDKSNVPPDAEGGGIVWANKDGEEYKFSVEFKDNKPVVTVTSPDGLKDTRKGVIASIVGATSFDIDEFVKLSDTKEGRKKQVEKYRALLPEDVLSELRGIENKIESAYTDRTETNRKIATLKGFIKEHVMWGEDLEIQPVDVSDIQKKVEEATKHNDTVKDVKQRITERQNTLARNAAELEELRAKIARIEAENKDATSKNEKAEKWLETNKETDITALNQQIADAGEINSKYAQAQDLKKKQADVDRLEEEAGNLTVMVDSGRYEIARTIREMNPIIPGLTFDDEQLLYNEVPVSHASLSTSQIMMLGIRLQMAQNPELGIIFLENGQSLDNAKLKLIQDMAKEHDLQVIMEEVDRKAEGLKIEMMGEV